MDSFVTSGIGIVVWVLLGILLVVATAYLVWRCVSEKKGGMAAPASGPRQLVSFASTGSVATGLSSLHGLKVLTNLLVKSDTSRGTTMLIPIVVVRNARAFVVTNLISPRWAPLLVRVANGEISVFRTVLGRTFAEKE